jgi:uncharacterized protein (DUF1697 family)
MTKLVAFLRGINVGGHVAKKEQLREAFESLSFQNVVTYKQSGNVIFEANVNDAGKIGVEIEEKLRDTLGYDVAVSVRSIAQLKTIVNSDPFKGQEKEGTSHLVTLLRSSPSKFPFELPAVIPKSTAKIVSAKGAEVFSETHGGGEGALPNPFLESKLKVKATTRNMNTIREIVKNFGERKPPQSHK